MRLWTWVSDWGSGFKSTWMEKVTAIHATSHHACDWAQMCYLSVQKAANLSCIFAHRKEMHGHPGYRRQSVDTVEILRWNHWKIRSNIGSGWTCLHLPYRYRVVIRKHLHFAHIRFMDSLRRFLWFLCLSPTIWCHAAMLSELMLHAVEVVGQSDGQWEVSKKKLLYLPPGRPPACLLVFWFCLLIHYLLSALCPLSQTSPEPPQGCSLCHLTWAGRVSGQLWLRHVCRNTGHFLAQQRFNICSIAGPFMTVDQYICYHKWPIGLGWHKCPRNQYVRR